MGARFFPSLANLYKGWWERAHIYGEGNPLYCQIRFFHRYIDDLIFDIEDYDFSLERFVEYLNDNTLKLKFIANKDEHTILKGGDGHI